MDIRQRAMKIVSRAHKKLMNWLSSIFILIFDFKEDLEILYGNGVELFYLKNLIKWAGGNKETKILLPYLDVGRY